MKTQQNKDEIDEKLGHYIINKKLIRNIEINTGDITINIFGDRNQISIYIEKHKKIYTSRPYTMRKNKKSKKRNIQTIYIYRTKKDRQKLEQDQRLEYLKENQETPNDTVIQ